MTAAKLLLVSIALHALPACGGNVSFPALGRVTRVEVRTKYDEPVLSIDDADRIKSIVEFVDRRHAGWGGATIDGAPIPEYVANFYDGDVFKGHFGYGRDFFET